MQWQPGIHYGMTTAHTILNIGRAINAGEITFYTDGTFNVSKNEICLLGVRIEKRCEGTVTVGFSVNPSESEDAMRATFDGLESRFFVYFAVCRYAKWLTVRSAGMSWKFNAEKK